MAHFAKLDNSNSVISVHVVNNDLLLVDGIESEQAGIDFLTQLHGHTLWKQTSYSGSFRKNYAGIGYTYDSDMDVFYSPKPYDSWVLNTETAKWESPIPYPTDGKEYDWSESNQQWIEVEPIVEVEVQGPIES
jgi:hypothetical protein